MLFILVYGRAKVLLLVLLGGSVTCLLLPDSDAIALLLCGGHRVPRDGGPVLLLLDGNRYSSRRDSVDS